MSVSQLPFVVEIKKQEIKVDTGNFYKRQCVSVLIKVFYIFKTMLACVINTSSEQSALAVHSVATENRKVGMIIKLIMFVIVGLGGWDVVQEKREGLEA